MGKINSDTNNMINGVVVQELKKIVDEKGKVMHMLRVDSPLFTKFGEVYFSSVNGGAIKAWKRHRIMTQHIAVPIGKIRLAIYDDRKSSSTCGQLDTIEIGEDNYSLVKIPPLLWYGFKGTSAYAALIVNCTDFPHDPAETERIDSDDTRIPYCWD